MAIRSILISRPPESVWAVLADARRYGDWVVGTERSEPLDDDWPAVGSAIRYVVRIGPWHPSGRTVVRDAEPGRRLELEAESKGLGTVRIGIEVRPWGDRSLVTVDEHPLTGPAGRLHTMTTDALLQIRHRRLIRNLARVLESGTDGAPAD